MSQYLIKTCETYRVDSEGEAKLLIEEAKQNPSFTLMKYTSELKTRKEKSEIVDEWYRVTLMKAFTEEKEPDRVVIPRYEEE